MELLVELVTKPAQHVNSSRQDLYEEALKFEGKIYCCNSCKH